MKPKIIFDIQNYKYLESDESNLKNIKGQIHKNKCIVLCGESGCGKSTLLRTINHLIPDFYEGTLQGRVFIDETDLKDLTIGQVSEKTSSVFQDPRSQFFTVNSTTEVAFGLENMGYCHDEIVKRVDEIFKHFHMEKLKDRPVQALSSGERQIIAILSAVAVGTEIILLDEPTANLDLAAIEQLKELLGQIKKEGKTIVINEHRLYFLNELADEYWLIKDGEIKKIYSKDELQKLDTHELENIGLRITDLDKIVPKTLEKQKKEQDCLELRDVSFEYKNHIPVLSQISFQGYAGEVIGIIGSNGSGKTTLGKTIAGLIKEKSGAYYFNKKPMSLKQRNNQVMFVMQEAEFQFFTNSVTRELCYGKTVTEAYKKELKEALLAFNLWEVRNNHPFSLSGGQMQKLTLLLAYFSEKPIIVLDEPTAGLDQRSLKCCIDFIKKMKKTKLVIIITHDLELISGVCDRCICIKENSISKEYSLVEKEEFSEIRDYMKNSFQLTDNAREDSSNRKRKQSDIRVFLIYLIVALLGATATDVTLLYCLMGALSLLGIVNKQCKAVVSFGAIFTALALIPFNTANTTVLFICNFFPRFLVIGLAVELIFARDGASEVLAAFRKMHIPEGVIMVSSVVFRFFPVILNDIKISIQAIKTRNMFDSGGKGVKKIPAYIEMLIVPMVFRMIRIAEFLSASAETRGITLKRRKESYIDLSMKTGDIVLIGFLAVTLLAYGTTLFY